MNKRIVVDVKGLNKKTKKEVIHLFEKLGYKMSTHAKIDYYLKADYYINFPNDNVVANYLYWKNGYLNPLEQENLITLHQLREMVNTNSFGLDDLQDRDVVYYRNGDRREVYKQALLDVNYRLGARLDDYNQNLKHKRRDDMNIMNVYRNDEMIFKRRELSEKQEKEILEQISVLEKETERLKEMVWGVR